MPAFPIPHAFPKLDKTSTIKTEDILNRFLGFPWYTKQKNNFVFLLNLKSTQPISVS
jgi:hypothetical protein